ncbi:MAG: hypothetical protein KJO08_01800 [Gammaproteobacteria bacterium]|nr:hypothetical protein [Gammaproteobacteria bacterium]
MATKGDLCELELHMDSRIKAAESGVIKWMVGIALAKIALLLGIFLKLS